jgi:hypothetical protein
MGRKENDNLIEGCKEGSLDKVELAICRGADVNYQNAQGNTPLYLVSLEGHIEIARILILKKARINSSEVFGVTPLFAASSKGHTKLAEFLISKGADVNYQNKDKYTSLYRASVGGHIETVKMLLTKDATIDEKTKSFAKRFTEEYTTDDDETPEKAVHHAKLGEIVKILKFWPTTKMIPVYKEATGIDFDPGNLETLNELYGAGKRRNKKSKKNKRKSNKSIKKRK